MRPTQRASDGFRVKTKKKAGHEGSDQRRESWTLFGPLCRQKKLAGNEER